MKKIFKEVIGWNIHILFALTIVIFTTTFILQPTQVSGISMEPTLHDEEYLLISKLPHTLKQPYDYGDIVVIDSRVNRKRKLSDDLMMNIKNNLIAKKIKGTADEYYWIKRIIGKEGDKIELIDNQIKRNGEILNESYINNIDSPSYTSNKITVPKGYVYVLGDNRNSSDDSRVIGCVPIENIIGKFFLSINK